MSAVSQRSSEIELVDSPQSKALENGKQASPLSISKNLASPSAVQSHDDEPISGEIEEYEPPEVGNLGVIDVFSFIVNKMIGTGIYTNPAMVLTLTGSRKAALSFWVVGFVYTLVSMFIYLSYASVIPYNTGELIYLDEITSYERRIEPSAPITPIKKWLRRYSGNGLFAYTTYAFIFIGTFNSGTNCMQLARQLLITIHPSNQVPEASILRFIAIVALSIVCLLQYFSPAVGRTLNKHFAFIKIGLLLAVFFAGINLLRKGEKVAQFNTDVATNNFDYAKALLLIIFAYEGWENANFVAGEIPRGSHHVLRKGFLWAVLAVGLLYIAINTLFLYALVEYTSGDTAPRHSGELLLTQPLTFPHDSPPISILPGTSIAPLFFGNSTSAIKCWGVLTAFSATGSVISIVYTFSRVKQAIGRMNIFPWSFLWGADDKQQHPPETGDLEKTPMGGLILHWIATVAVISATASINNILNAVTFPGLLQSYAHSLILIPISLGLLRIRSRADALHFDREKLRPLDKFLTSLWSDDNIGVLIFLALAILAYIACNSFLVVDYLIPPYNGVDGWVLAVIIGSLVLLATLYYFALFGSFLPDPDIEETDSEEDSGPDPRDGNGSIPWSLFTLADVRVRIRKSDAYDESTPDARRFGSRRKITYHEGRKADFLYWFFGGRNLYRTPWERIQDLRMSWF